MRRFEREVTDPVLINEMLKLMDTAYIGVNDADGIPYVVPLSFGYEMTDTELVPFEGRYYRLTKFFDGYLKKLYGNYMEIPPVEKREHHVVYELDFGEYANVD